MSISNEQLKKLLLDNGLITEAQFKEVLEISEKENISSYQALLRKDLISDEHLGRLISEFINKPFAVLSKVSISREVLTIIPEIVARKQKIIAFARDKDGIKVASFYPENEEVFGFIAKKTGEKVNVYFATEKDVDEALSLYKSDLQSTFNELLTSDVKKPDEVEVSISKTVDLLIQYAQENKASDIHIEPEDNKSLVRFRIDGVMHDVLSLPKKFHEQLVARIKVLARLRTDEHLSAQDGKIQFELEGEKLDIRVSVVPIVGGENVVMRLLSSRSRQFSLSDLGMKEDALNKVKSGFTKPFGMVLSTGPTGCGKTTTIYSVLKLLNVREKNIATIEDPVEYDIEGINQIQVNSKTNLTFADGLRAILRQDPDIIFVGEIRDEETASIAVNSAMTGHLVLSTLHTNDASTALPRLADMGIESFLVASTVNIIIGQRLVRRICERCRVSEMIKTESLQEKVSKLLLKDYFGEDKEEFRIYKGKGCPVCHLTGYVGRVGIFEVLEINENIKKLIMAKESADVIRAQAIKDGMVTMFQDGLSKALEGITTVDEVLRATKM